MAACLVVAVLLGLPRIVLAGIWLLTPWIGRAYDGWVWPLLGFLFLPYTTLAYTAAMLHNDHRLDGVWLVIVIVAVLVDLGVIGKAGHQGHRRRD